VNLARSSAGAIVSQIMTDVHGNGASQSPNPLEPARP
jgi:hypothetical protein